MSEPRVCVFCLQYPVFDDGAFAATEHTHRFAYSPSGRPIHIIERKATA